MSSPAFRALPATTAADMRLIIAQSYPSEFAETVMQIAELVALLDPAVARDAEFLARLIRKEPETSKLQPLPTLEKLNPRN